ncbi:MAG: GNAT family N-acetyltransferase [Proteobacteria bacterium]|nr:GNAT family N-acetyltransferase [Pseudomonadota bacterium]
MGFTIRAARVEDLPKVVDLAVDAVSHSVSPFREIPPTEVQEFRRRDLLALNDAIHQPHVGIFMAEEEGSGRFLGHVVIVCGYTESSTGESQGWIFDLAVVPDAWSHGVGQALMRRAEDFSRSRGFKYIGLGVTTANERAVRFYERMGYAEERKRMIKILDLEAPSHGG